MPPSKRSAARADRSRVLTWQRSAEPALHYHLLFARVQSLVKTPEASRVSV